MSAKTATKQSSDTLPEKWKGYANEDALIDAWVDGREKGKKERTRELTEFFHKNLKRTFELSEELHTYMVEELGAKCALNKVKPEQFNTFESLYAVDKALYLDKDFRKKVYQMARELTKKGAAEDINLDFITTSSTPEMNRSVLITNGYWYEFRPKKAK